MIVYNTHTCIYMYVVIIIIMTAYTQTFYILGIAIVIMYFPISIRESVNSLCRDDMDAPIVYIIHFKSLQTFIKHLDSKAFWIAYCVSGVIFCP